MSPPVPPTEAVRPGLWSIGVPFPDNPLGYTLVYLIESDRGPVLVDAGWDDDVSWAALVEGFRAAGTDVSECYGVLVTHVHPDHHGLSGRVREASDAWVAMHERDAVTVERLSSTMADDHDRERRPTHTSSDFADELLAVLLDAGASEDELAAAPATTRTRRGAAVPAARRPGPHGRRRRPRRRAGVGHRRRVDPRPHARPPLLPRARPPHPAVGRPRAGRRSRRTSRSPAATVRGDPLGDFLASLQKVAALDTDEVLPAHRHRFADLPARIDEITPPPPRPPGEHRGDPRHRPGVAVGGHGAADVEPPVGPVPAGAAPLGGQRDGGPPALPRPSWARRPG